MKKGLLTIKKILWLLFTAAILLALPACGGFGETDSGAPKTVSASGDMVTAELPSGWSLVSGTDMNGVDLADFICHAEEFELGDPYSLNFDGEVTEGQWWFNDACTICFMDDYGEAWIEVYYDASSWEITGLEYVSEMYYPRA